MLPGQQDYRRHDLAVNPQYTLYYEHMCMYTYVGMYVKAESSCNCLVLRELCFKGAINPDYAQ